MKLDPYHVLYIKIDSKEIQDLNVRAKTLRRKYRCKSLWPWLDNGFLGMTPNAQAAKEKIDKLDITTIKIVCTLLCINLLLYRLILFTDLF